MEYRSTLAFFCEKKLGFLYTIHLSLVNMPLPRAFLEVSAHVYGHCHCEEVGGGREDKIRQNDCRLGPKKWLLYRGGHWRRFDRILTYSGELVV